MLRMSLLLLALSLPALATAQADFERCAAIDVAAERLACFDALTRAPAPDAKPEAEVLDAAPAVPRRQVLTPERVATVEPPAAPAIDQFGAESLPASVPEKSAPDRIEARLKGRFAGWDKDTVFELDNGQVWQCQKCREVYHQAESPQVTIRRSFTGVYWLKVEGLNHQAKVRRVK